MGGFWEPEVSIFLVVKKVSQDIIAYSAENRNFSQSQESS